MTLHKERILAVAEAIRLNDGTRQGFNMADFYDSTGRTPDLSGFACGTTACIGGWASLVAWGSNRGTLGAYEAAEWMGLDARQRDALYCGIITWFDDAPYKWLPFAVLGSITPAQAIEVLEYLAHTGQVDWTRVIGKEKISLNIGAR